MDTNDIRSLVDFWYHYQSKHYWFNQNDTFDKTVCETFGGLLNNTNMEDIKDIIEYADSKKDSFKILLGYIILYDQVHRHFIRYYNKTVLSNMESMGITNIPKMEKKPEFDYIAQRLSFYIIEQDQLHEYKPEEIVFILLPLRHTFDENNIILCIRIILDLRKIKDSSYFIRFYKASIRSIANIRNNNSLIPHMYVHDIDNDEKIKSILDEKSSLNIYTIHELSYNNITKIFKKTYINIIKELRANGITRLVVSLSGGVDSMVASFVLKQLCKGFGIELVAFTINYDNRETSIYETLFVSRWCHLLKIPHYIRTINELHRNRYLDREFYEQVTKEIRFEMYRLISKLSDKRTAIILGHNQDDCVENIIANISKSNKLNNLKGMIPILEENGVILVRPMLNIPKKRIYEFSNEYMIPFVWDSTPTWSARGRTRDILIPQLESFSGELIPGLLSMSKYYAEMYDLYKTTILGDIKTKLYNMGDHIIFDIPDNFKFICIVSKDIIYHICKELGYKMVPTNKTIESFTETMAQIMSKKKHNKREIYMELIQDGRDTLTVCYLTFINKMIFIRGHDTMSIGGNHCMETCGYKKDKTWVNWEPK